MDQSSVPSSPPPPPPPPHVLIFPIPGQGHVNSMLKLAELLCLNGFHVTFLNYEYIHENLVLCSDIEPRFAIYSGFQFKTIPNCWQPGAAAGNTGDSLREVLVAMKVKSKPEFKKILIEVNDRTPVTCVIGDMLMGYVHDVAGEVGIPAIQFHTIGACAFWTSYSIADVVAAHELPVKGKEEMDRLITKVPGMETFLRRRDLPSFCQESSDPNILIIKNEMRQSNSLILNTFEQLEAPILSQIRTHYPKTYAIGPLHELLKSKLITINSQEQYSTSNSTREVDRSCIEWLNDQPKHSVLYVSFGSTTILTIDQFLEFWHGIINSKKSFLWVIRPESITNRNGDFLEKIPVETSENGYIVKWAPQEEVLGHKSIGGFLTHSGWNSTLESIVAGVPMICWPYYADQQVNSRLVSEVWKVGLDMKDTCNREIVEKIVNDLMVNRRDEFMRSLNTMKEFARKSIEKDGSSSCNLDSLIEDIRLMSK
ncbi:7-deoxyloganetic acid glucosyl transferase-like [Mercurialis annua]|uniref:7-deoxyloganetic acid glucosyl transferase-like n=1 Tax=Mercurialis annua TaxID=3986 RepID=UPI0024AF7D22|nr:7-deoxyloganetic acid glucosyl transferase-like [Mercurialis annua]